MAKDNDGKRTVEEKRKKENLLGGAAVASGGLAVKKLNDKGYITGRETLYHNTAAKNVDSILESGLLSRHAARKGSISDLALQDIPDHLKKGRVYLAKKKSGARAVGRAHLLHSPFLDSGQEIRKNLRVRAPLWNEKEFKLVGNPELRGLDLDGFVKMQIKRNPRAYEMYPVFFKWDTKNSYKIIGPDSTVVIKGDLAPKYIKGSKHFKGATVKEILEFAKKNPSKFAKGIAGAAVSGGVTAAGVATILKNKRHKKETELRKDASDLYRNAIEKTASDIVSSYIHN